MRGGRRDCRVVRVNADFSFFFCLVVVVVVLKELKKKKKKKKKNDDGIFLSLLPCRRISECSAALGC